jgi:trimeric autotransporter adhesin
VAPYAGQEGTTVDLAGQVSDVDDPSPSRLWTITPGANVDPGTVNGDLFVPGTPVTFTGPFTDVGPATHTCTVDLVDGVPIADGAITGTPDAGTCVLTHSFTRIGPHQVVVRVTDDDSGAATAVVRVVVYLPGEAFALSASGRITIARTPLATCPAGRVSHGRDALHTGWFAHSTPRRPHPRPRQRHHGRTRVAGQHQRQPDRVRDGVDRHPGVATVYYNETTTVGSMPAQNAIRVRTLLGQEIVLAGCRLG